MKHLYIWWENIIELKLRKREKKIVILFEFKNKQISFGKSLCSTFLGRVSFHSNVSSSFKRRSDFMSTRQCKLIQITILRMHLLLNNAVRSKSSLAFLSIHCMPSWICCMRKIRNMPYKLFRKLVWNKKERYLLIDVISAATFRLVVKCICEYANIIFSAFSHIWFIFVIQTKFH